MVIYLSYGILQIKDIYEILIGPKTSLVHVNEYINSGPFFERN